LPFTFVKKLKMIAIVEVIGAVSILTAIGILTIYSKESFLGRSEKPKLEFQKHDNPESFINMDIENLVDNGETGPNPEETREKRRGLESFQSRNKFYYSK
jgi:hypothetical protein